MHKDITKKDLIIKIDTTRLFVGLKGQAAINDGEWTEKIKADESLWTLEDSKSGKILHLAIAKHPN